MKKERLLSLDVFRGITIAAMILVNDPGDWSNVYAPLLHAHWNGYTPTDLIFPFFIFIMGVAISLSKPKVGVERKSIVYKSLKRTLILFLIGLFLNGFPFFELSSLRIPGVLQRIALVFMGCIWLYQYLDSKKVYWVGAGILVVYWIVMSFIPVPGGTPSNLDPGTNFAAWMDEALLSGHMYSQTKTWDPEGILSTFPAIVTGIMGIWTGNNLFRTADKVKALLKIMVIGVLSIWAALIWDLSFPINKSLWTSSYVLITGGWGMISFAILFWFLDVEKYDTIVIKPFMIFGLNSITVYAFSGVLSTSLYLLKIGDNSLKGHVFEMISFVFDNAKFSSFVFAVLFVLVSYIPIWVLYKKGIFIKV
ncbi:MAG: DUF5009 domain-containing protein [Reichenbachiella sp.]